MIVCTTNDVAGHRVVRHLGLVRGITVRSRSVIGNIGAGIQSLFPATLSTLTTDLQKVGVRMGLVFTLVSFAALMGPPGFLLLGWRARRA